MKYKQPCNQISTSNIGVSVSNIHEDIFTVQFDQSIEALEAGKVLLLQLPHNANSVHDCNYDLKTVEKCIEAIKAQYSDLQLSIMKIIGSDNISNIEIKNVNSKARELIGDKLVERPLNFWVLKDNDRYHAIENDKVHKYYTNNQAWRTAFELSDLFSEECLKALFYGGY